MFGSAPQAKKYSTRFADFSNVATMSGLLYSHLFKFNSAPICCNKTMIVMTSSMTVESNIRARTEEAMRLVKGVLPPLSKLLASAPANSKSETTSVCRFVTANWNYKKRLILSPVLSFSDLFFKVDKFWIFKNHWKLSPRWSVILNITNINITILTLYL